MKEKKGLQFVNKATAGVGAVFLLLVLNLASGNPLFNLFVGGGVSAGTRPTPPPPAPVASKERIGKSSLQTASRSTIAPAGRVKDEFARYDPSLNLDELKDLVSRPVPKLGRNPFVLESTPQDLKPNGTPTSPSPPPPPPPPPILLKVVGTAEKPGGTQEAYICETGADGKCREDVEVYVVHEGEQFGNHFRAVKITPQQIEVEDQNSHQTAQLVISQ